MAIPDDPSSNLTPSSFSDSSNFSPPDDDTQSPPSPHGHGDHDDNSSHKAKKNKSHDSNSSPHPSPKPPKSPKAPSKPPKHSPHPKAPPPSLPPPPPSPPPPPPPPPRAIPPPSPTLITPPPPSHLTPPQVIPPSHPPPPPPPPLPPNRPTTPPQSPPPPSRSGGGSSSKRHFPPPAWSSSHSRVYIEQHVGFAVAAISLISVVAFFIFYVLRKRKDRDRDFQYYVDKTNNGAQGGMYGSQRSQFTPVGGSGGYGSSGSNKRGGGVGMMYHLRSPSQISGGPMFYSYEQIVGVTKGFSSENVIGEGGFGYVYKALMPDGRVGAVKMLKSGSGQGDREFSAEIEIISRVHHRHLVSLIGYCIAQHHRVLVYEFVPNGNLSQHLHGNNFPVLDWANRMKIANGAAKGLAYLHEGCNPRIIHRDIKSANILLDNAYEARVADFGLARLTDDANTHVSTRVMGTFGYMAPEYATSGKLTDRSDVFSFGVVLLELITGRKPVDPTQPIGHESLVEWARPHLLEAMGTREVGDLVDPRLQGRYVHTEMFTMIEAAAACVRHSAPNRPRMVQFFLLLIITTHNSKTTTTITTPNRRLISPTFIVKVEFCHFAGINHIENSTTTFLWHCLLPLSSKPSLFPFPRRQWRGGDCDVMFNDAKTRGDRAEILRQRLLYQTTTKQLGGSCSGSLFFLDGGAELGGGGNSFSSRVVLYLSSHSPLRLYLSLSAAARRPPFAGAAIFPFSPSALCVVARALEGGDQLDLSNGVRYGESIIYNSSQYNSDIMRYRRMMADGSFSVSDYDLYSTQHSSRELYSSSSSSGMPTRPGGNSEPRNFKTQRSFAEQP
ncbi:hypothetical protein PIB30_006283 [Stylosanthes scabra]|uniref:non-specific serine/threonine protein kinase n=1 Tax=Stylosanthes scabra TaxID=79078 RepID=A0ABU6Q494_9FABA|nr:hypothetical protein [Stylosanthes scabra]